MWKKVLKSVAKRLCEAATLPQVWQFGNGANIARTKVSIPYLVYCIPLWGSLPKIKEFNKLFVIQKQPLFQNTTIVTIYNLFFLVSLRPPVLFDKFGISKFSSRCIYPKLSLSRMKQISFLFNSSKILNYFAQHDINCNQCFQRNTEETSTVHTKLFSKGRLLMVTL